jgi:hypothetical protein
MGAHVAGVATLRDSTVWVLSTVCVDLVGAVVLVVRLAIGASQIGACEGVGTKSVYVS